MDEAIIGMTQEEIADRWKAKTPEEIMRNIREMVKNIMASSPVKSMLSEWDRRYRAATFNALKQEGYRKISIRDNGDGTATIKYKDPREVTR